MSLGHVTADDKETVALLNVGVAANGLIRAKGGDITAHGTGHTEAGISFNVVGLQAAAENFLKKIGLLGLGLAGTIITN